MALIVHSGLAALDLSTRYRTEHWDIAGVSVGEILNLNGQYYEVLAISGNDVSVAWMAGVTTSTPSISTAMVWNPSRSYANTDFLYARPEVMPEPDPPQGPPSDIESPRWPLWLNETPKPDWPPPSASLTIPIVADLILCPKFRNGERIDPFIGETPSETAAREEREREARQWAQAMTAVEQGPQRSQWWRFWRKQVA